LAFMLMSKFSTSFKISMFAASQDLLLPQHGAYTLTK
jgi:hypothetical protein